MTPDLDRYQAAFERVEQRLRLARDWSATEARVRRRLARPTGRLVASVLILVACVVAGLNGVTSAWLVAGGILLAVLPERIADVRERGRETAAIETAEDVRALCLREAREASATAFLRFLLHGGIGLLFLVTGLLLVAFGKDGRPGAIAGLVALAWGCVNLLVLLPRAAREIALLGGDDAGEEEDADDDAE